MTPDPERGITDETTPSDPNLEGDTTTRWGSHERRSATLFLIAGLLLLVATVVTGLEMVAEIEGPELVDLGAFFGLVLAYIGLLGLYPRLADQAPQLARAAVLLLVVPVVGIILSIGLLAIGIEPPWGQEGAVAIFGGFALGVALFGIASFQTHAPSRAVGIFLLVFAGMWAVLLGVGLWSGFPIPERSNLVGLGIMTGTLLAIGFLLRAETGPADRTEPAPTEARHD